MCFVFWFWKIWLTGFFILNWEVLTDFGVSSFSWCFLKVKFSHTFYVFTSVNCCPWKGKINSFQILQFQSVVFYQTPAFILSLIVGLFCLNFLEFFFSSETRFPLAFLFYLSLFFDWIKLTWMHFICGLFVIWIWEFSLIRHKFIELWGREVEFVLAMLKFRWRFDRSVLIDGRKGNVLKRVDKLVFSHDNNL